MKYKQPTNLPRLECLNMQELSFFDEHLEGEDHELVEEGINNQLEAVNSHLEDDTTVYLTALEAAEGVEAPSSEAQCHGQPLERVS